MEQANSYILQEQLVKFCSWNFLTEQWMQFFLPSLLQSYKIHKREMKRANECAELWIKIKQLNLRKPSETRKGSETR